MAERDVSASVASDLTNTVTTFTVDEASTDGATDQKETTWMNEDYGQYLGYYNSIPEVASVTDAKPAWTMGKGYEADEFTEMILDRIKGNGKETFISILETMDRTREIGEILMLT